MWENNRKIYKCAHYTLSTMANDTTLRLKKTTKRRLDDLNFVKKGWSYDDILDKLIEAYNKK